MRVVREFIGMPKLTSNEDAAKFVKVMEQAIVDYEKDIPVLYMVSTMSTILSMGDSSSYNIRMSNLTIASMVYFACTQRENFDKLMDTLKTELGVWTKEDLAEAEKELTEVEQKLATIRSNLASALGIDPATLAKLNMEPKGEG